MVLFINILLLKILTKTYKGVYMKQKLAILAVLTNVKHNNIPYATPNFLESIDTISEEFHSFNGPEVIIDCAPETAYENAKLAGKHGLSIALKNNIHHISKMSKKEFSSFMLSISITEQQGKEATRLMVYSLMEDVPKKMNEKEASSVISHTAPSSLMIDGEAAAVYAVKTLNAAFLDRKKSVASLVSVSNENENAIFLKMDYDSDLIKYMLKNPGIYILNGQLGSGKTQNGTLPAFNALIEAKLFPIFISPRRLLTAQLIDFKYHYDNPTVRASMRDQKQSQLAGLGAVVNSVFSPLFASFKNKSQSLIIEEIEEVLDHLTGKAIGTGNIEERAAMTNDLFSLIKNKKLVIMADAMICDHTVNAIAKETGKKVHIVSPFSSVEHTQRITINVYATQEENIAQTNSLLDSGLNVAAFCDASHNENRSKFSEIFKSINKQDRNCLMLDASNMKGIGAFKFVKELDESLKKYNYVQTTPVINSGVSVQNGHFSVVSMMSSQTLSPKGSIQSMRRFRDVLAINFSSIERRPAQPTDPLIILANEMRKCLDAESMGDGALKQYENKPGMKLLLSRIAHENKSRNSYTNHTLMIAEHMGWEVVLIKKDEEAQTVGRTVSYEGRKIEEAERSFFIMTSAPISDTEAKIISNGISYAKKEDKWKLAAFRMRKAYCIKDTESITQEFIDHDENGKGQIILKNTILADSNKCSGTSNEVIKLNAIKMIMKLLNIDIETMTGSYSSEDAKVLLAWIDRGTVAYGKNIISASEAITLSFPNVSLSSVPGKVAKSIMKHVFAIDTKETGGSMLKGVRSKNYTTVHNKISKMNIKIRNHIKNI